MTKIPKIIIAGIVTVIMFVALYYGAYLPVQKSQLYINAIRSFEAAKPRSVEEFNNIFNPALDAKSPIGYDEITGAYLGILLNVLNQQSNPQVIEALVRQAEERMAPIMAVKRGINYSQNVFQFAQIYRLAAVKLGSETYYKKSVETFKQGLEASPKRPVFLYSLLDLEFAAQDYAAAKTTAETILKYWPGDTQVEEILKQLKGMENGPN